MQRNINKGEQKLNTAHKIK